MNKIMDTKLTVHEIEDLIVSYEGGVRNKLCVPNVSWGLGIDYEADLLIITKTGYCTEYEIKRSYSDFLADMKKSEDGLPAMSVFGMRCAAILIPWRKPTSGLIFAISR